MLELEKISFSRGRTEILDRLNASAPKASFTILAGGNGTGKTTLLNCISGSLKMNSGIIKYNAGEIDPESPEWRRTLSYVPDDGGTIPVLTVDEQLRLQCMLNNVDKDQAVERTESIMESLGLIEHRSHRADELSAGFRKKLGLAIGLVRDADLYIFDEPFSSLDIEAAAAFKDLMKLLKKRSRTIILSTHSPFFIRDICDSVWLLADKRIRISSTDDYFNGIALPAAETPQKNNAGRLSWIEDNK